MKEDDRRLGVAIGTAVLVMLVLIFVGIGFGLFNSRPYMVGLGLAGGLSFALGYRVLYRLFR